MNAAEQASDPVHLDPRQVAEIADRVTDVIVERLVEAIKAERSIPQEHASVSWLDAKAVADLLGVERDWVYEHADELGASRIGSGPRPRLRFPPGILDSRSHTPARPGENREPAKRPSKPTGLIPIHSQ